MLYFCLRPTTLTTAELPCRCLSPRSHDLPHHSPALSPHRVTILSPHAPSGFFLHVLELSGSGPRFSGSFLPNSLLSRTRLVPFNPKLSVVHVRQNTRMYAPNLVRTAASSLETGPPSGMTHFLIAWRRYPPVSVPLCCRIVASVNHSWAYLGHETRE